MSNRIYLEAREIKILKTGETWQELHISDDYSCFSLDTAINGEEFIIPDDDLGKLKAIIDFHKEGGGEDLNGIINYLQSEERGILIEDTYYEWEEIKHLFK